MAAHERFTLDDNFISSDAGNGWAACYRLVNGKIKSPRHPARSRSRHRSQAQSVTSAARMSLSMPTSWGNDTGTATASGI